MTTLTQGIESLEFLISEANGKLSRDQCVVTVGAAALPSGTVLGMVSAGATATSAAVTGNAGNGTMGAVTLNTLATQIGVYALRYLTATTFTVTAPNGATATGSNGVAFSALGIGLTMTTGGTPMVANDGFNITVAATVGRPTATAAAVPGNTGNSTSSAVTVTGYAPKAGNHVLTILEPGANTGEFNVFGPDGLSLGNGVVGTAFSGGGLTFTLADGATDFAAGDQFVITVAAGSGKYRQQNDASVDGSQVAVAVLGYGLSDLNADAKALVFTNDCEVIGNRLNGGTTPSASVQAALRLVGIKVR
jgi:Bacteriophage lambda head decoration protein D